MNTVRRSCIRIFGMYGELKNAKTAAKTVV